MSAGKIALTFILALMTGAILGAVIYNHYYELSETIMEKYDLLFMTFPALTMFVVGYFIGHRGQNGVEREYKPIFHGNVQQLGKEGDKIITIALQRAGLIREKK